MATNDPTSNEKGRKTVQIELPKGVTAIERSDGTVAYRATVGKANGRRQLTFATLDEAVAYKAFGDEFYARHGFGPNRECFLASLRDGSKASGAGAATPILCGVMVSRIAEQLGEEYKNEKSLDFPKTVFLRFLKERELIDEPSTVIDGDLAESFQSWLRRENYDRNTQSTILTIVRRIMAKAERKGYVDKNHFRDLPPSRKRLPDLRRDGSSRHAEEAPAWSLAELVAFAMVLRTCYVLPFWLIVILGLRASEATGLRLRDWYFDRPYLRVQFQRQYSPAIGLSDVKTSASRRVLPVGPALAELIDRYVEHVHGPMPTDKQAKVEWLNRYLLVGVKGGPMNQGSLRDNVRKAIELVTSISHDEIRCAPLHHLRKTVGQILQSALVTASLNGRAVSDYLGHRTSATPEVSGASPITRAHYNPAVMEQLEDVGRYLDGLLCDEIIPLAPTGDLLEPATFTDGITTEEAARRLQGHLAPEVAELEVRSLILTGELTAAAGSVIGAVEDVPVMVSAEEVDQLISRLIRASSDTYCATEVGELLCTDHRGVYRLADAGEIDEVTIASRTRQARHGNRGGALPGGGRRFTKASVDAIVKRDAIRLERLRTWLTVGEAADLLLCSPDTVRRMADRGELKAWRDQAGRRERRICPKSVDAARQRSDVPYHSAARELGVTVARVAALAKVGDLTVGSKPKTVVRASLEAYPRSDAA